MGVIGHVRRSGLAAAVLLGLAAAGPAADEQTAPPAVIPVEAFAELPFLENPVLSPDGSRIAARVYRAGRERLGVFRLTGRADEPPAIVDLGEEADMIGWQWAGNDRLLIRISKVEPFYGADIPVSRVIAYDRQTGTARALRAGEGISGDDIIFVDPAGAYILLSAQPNPLSAPAVYRIDLDTGRATIVEHQRDNVWNWFADTAGTVRAGIEYGERSIRIFYRQAAGARLRIVEVRRGTEAGAVLEMIRFLGGSDRGVIVTNSETGRFGVYEYDFSTETRGATLFEHDEVDVGAVLIGEDGLIDGVSFEDDRPRVRWFDPERARIQAAIDRALPGRTNVIRGMSDGGDRVLIWSGTAEDPGAYAIYMPAERRIDAIAPVHAALRDRDLSPVRPIRYRSRDGLTIHGYLTLPRGRPERNLPLIVLPHGGPFARDSWAFDLEVQFLASRGYAVLQPNFRGSTGYGRDFVERGHGEWGSGMIDDIEDGMAWLAEQGIADADRVCIMGSSYGGYAALWSAVRSPRLYRCAISFAGVTDLRAMLRYDARFIVARRYMRDWRRQVQGEERTDLDAISPLRQATRLNLPVLIAHGERDRRVPPSQSRELVRALNQRGGTVESVFYREAAHGFSRPEDRLDYLRRVEAFLARHNPA